MTKTYNRQTAKFLAVVGENMPELSGGIMQGWIENPKALQKFLAGLCPPNKFPIWKTIKLGTGLKTADDFRKAMENRGMIIGDWANDILGKPAFTVASNEIEIDLVKVTVAELGFKKGARRDQIYQRAQELGLAICPAEVGPQLRLQYPDQPNREWDLIGMEPILNSDGDPDVFSVGRRVSDLWLYSHWAHPVSVWHSDYSLLFALLRK